MKTEVLFNHNKFCPKYTCAYGYNTYGSNQHVQFVEEKKNIARSEQSSYTPNGSHQRKDKIVKDFIILNQVVSEKTLMKNVHMCYIRVTKEKLKKEGKMRFSTLIFIYTIHFAYLTVYTKFHNPKSSSC